MAPVASFTVADSSGVPVGPLAASIDGADAADFAISANACDGTTLQPGVTCMITVRFKPSTTGDKTANLNVTGPGTKLMSTPSGTGTTAAKITLSPTSQSFGTIPLGMKNGMGMISLEPSTPDPFGSVAIGESASAFFLVKNIGTTDVGKLAPSISGSSNEFTLTDNSCPDPLPANAVCALTVKFTPLVIGRRTANLQVFAPPGPSPSCR